MKKWGLVFILVSVRVLAIGPTGQSKVSELPTKDLLVKDAILNQCGVDPLRLPFFLRISNSFNDETIDRLIFRWDSACEEFEDPKESEVAAHAQIIPLGWVKAQVYLTSIYSGLFSLGFARLHDTTEQQVFQAKLKKISDNPDRNWRARETFNLVRFYQGQPDAENTLRYLHPGRILKRAGQGGPSGVCRDFASLLYWALLQTARPRGNFASVLENEYNPEIRIGETHWWVRLHFPYSGNQSRKFRMDSIDLDSMDYLSFTPLMPRQEVGLVDVIPSWHGWCRKTIP